MNAGGFAPLIMSCAAWKLCLKLWGCPRRMSSGTADLFSACVCVRACVRACVCVCVCERFLVCCSCCMLVFFVLFLKGKRADEGPHSTDRSGMKPKNVYMQLRFPLDLSSCLLTSDVWKAAVVLVTFQRRGNNCQVLQCGNFVPSSLWCHEQGRHVFQTLIGKART